MGPLGFGEFLIAAGAFVLLGLVSTALLVRPLPTIVWALASLPTVFFVVVFLAAEVAATAREERPALTTYITYPTLRLLQARPEQMDISGYKATVSTVLKTLLAINTIWFAVILPAGIVKRLRAELAAKEVVQIKPIRRRGEDDVQTLIELLDRAHRAVMFAGAFDWLLQPGTDSERAKKLTSRLKATVSAMLTKNQITFVSNIRKRADVEQLLRSIDAGFAQAFIRRFVDNSKSDKKVFFTLVWYDGDEKAFCSRVGPIEGRSTCMENNIVVDSRTPGGRVLIQIVNDLIDPRIISGQAAGEVLDGTYAI